MRKITSLLTLLLLMVSGVNVWGQLPSNLELTTDKNSPKYYHIKSLRTSSGQYWQYRGDNTNPNQVSTKEEAGFEGYWFFMKGSTDETVKIFCYKGSALTHNLHFTAEGNDWFIKKISDKEGYNTISKDANDVTSQQAKNCIDSQSGGLGYWYYEGGNNPGTAWAFEKAEAPNYTQKINNAFDETKLNTSTDNSFVGFISEEQKAIINEAKTKALENPTMQSYESFLQTIKDNSVGFEEGCFYMIEHQNTGNYKYPSTQNMHMGKTGDNLPYGQSYDDRVIRRVTNEAPLLPRLWKIAQDGKGYRITNANTNCKWANYPGSGDLDMPADPNNQGGLYNIENIPATNAGFNTVFYIKINNHLMNAFGGDGNQGKVIAAYDQATDKGGFWSFKKVTEIPVAIGAAGWASICMPFPVAIPAGITAYVAESAKDNVITLKEVKGTVPAKTAMIITGATDSEVKFAIAKAAAATEVNTNLFSGTTTERIGFGTEETFAMGAKDNSAAFMKNNLRKDYLQENPVYVPANKAYILSSNLSAAAQGASLLSIEFGGATTGIEGVEAEDAKEVIYFDLNGRRVMNPAHGVFVTNTGKKVFIR